jgi:hypothetical protein
MGQRVKLCLVLHTPLLNKERLTTAFGVAILGGIKLANERRAVEGNIAAIMYV